MASSPYVPQSFGEEPLSSDKMNQMANNIQWIYENSPRILYNAHGVKKQNGTKILVGCSVVPAANRTLSSVTVYFGTFFSQSCRPIVVATPVKNTGRTRYEMVVGGIGTTYPDHRGVTLYATTDEYSSASNYHAVAVPINWIAVGW